MIEVIFLLSLGLVWILFATLSDLKTREVPNWLNFSLVIFALMFRFLWSFFERDFSFFYFGLIGFGVFFILGYLFYYARFFAGGDAKLLISLGAILPFSTTFISNGELFIFFLIGLLFVGAIYGLGWSVFLSVKNFNNLKRDFGRRFKRRRILVFSVMIFGLLLTIGGFFEWVFLYLGILIFISPVLLIYARSLEDVGMVKRIFVEKLREGDWLYEDVRVGKGLVQSRWEGLSEEEIKILKKKKRFVKIKQGIPFVPVFLVSYILVILNYFVFGVKVF